MVQLCVGIVYLWSVFNSPVSAAFGLSKSAASMVSSYMLLAFVVGCLVGGILDAKKGPRATITIGVLLFGIGVGASGLLTPETAGLINLTYAILGGLGSGFAYTACMSCIQKWFPTKRGFASGLAAAFFGLSTVIFAPVSRGLMTAHTVAETGLVNFRPVFLTLGILFLVIGLVASMFVRLPAPGSPQAEAAAAGAGGKAKFFYPDDLSLGQVVKKPAFWCLFFAVFFGAATWTLVVPLISNLGVERGLTIAAATLTVSLTGIINAIGRLVLASLSDKIGRRGAFIVVCALTVIGAGLLTFIGGVGYSAAILVIAFAYGGPGPLAAAFAVDFFGAKNSARNFGLITLSLGITSLVCNAVSNNVLHGNATPTFIMAAVMAIIPIGLMFVLRSLEKRAKSAVEEPALPETDALPEPG